MGLITKEVKVLVHGQNVKRFEELGYYIPRYYSKESSRYVIKRGTYITVKVDDLSDGSTEKIKVKCDCCGVEKEILYTTYYNRRHKEDGKYYCKSCASKMYISGENNHFWNPNLTDDDRQSYHKATAEYNKFIRTVLARDNYKCQCCGNTNKESKLEVHHLDAFKEHQDKRTDTTNGITLCYNCHKSFHSWHRVNYGFDNRGNCTKEQFEEWFGHSIKLVEANIKLAPVRMIYCIEEDRVYESAKEVQKAFGLSSKNSVYKVCNKNNTRERTIRGKHFLFYDEYITMTKEEVDYYVNVIKAYRIKKVRCITTGEIFNSLKDAEISYPKCSHIWDCCKGKANYSGTLPDGTKLQWEYCA